MTTPTPKRKRDSESTLSLLTYVLYKWFFIFSSNLISSSSVKSFLTVFTWRVTHLKFEKSFGSTPVNLLGGTIWSKLSLTDKIIISPVNAHFMSCEYKRLNNSSHNFVVLK